MRAQRRVRLGRGAVVLSFLLGGAAAVLIEAASARAQDGEKWWPSEWGPDDQRGAVNRITPPSIVIAAQLIRHGEIFQLGRPYEHGMPLPGKRHFSLTIPGSPTGTSPGTNGLVYHDDLFSGEIGQIGTQLDGLGHVGIRRADGEDYFYNGFKRSEFGQAHGLAKLGVEHVGVFFARGVLLDVAAHRGVDAMKAGDVITPADLEATAHAQGVAVGEGDVVLIRTGHGKLWMTDNEAFSAGEPGPGIAAARWLTDRKIVLVGADTWALEVVPHEDKDQPFIVHQHLLVRNGVYILENLDLEALAAARAHEFAFVFSPLRMKGATGSPGNPIAVR